MVRATRHHVHQCITASVHCVISAVITAQVKMVVRRPMRAQNWRVARIMIHTNFYFKIGMSITDQSRKIIFQVDLINPKGQQKESLLSFMLALEYSRFISRELEGRLANPVPTYRIRPHGLSCFSEPREERALLLLFRVHCCL